MRRIVVALTLIAGSLVAAAAWWRRHPRVGSAYMNRVVNPWLMERGLTEKSAGEIGLLEHVGRRSGTVHLSPVHPVPIEGGFRIVVPLGLESEWARNVVAAGHARIQIGGLVHDVDEPMLLSPIEVRGVPPLAGHVMSWLGFRYLVVREFATRAGTLDAPLPTDTPAGPAPEPSPELAPTPAEPLPAAV